MPRDTDDDGEDKRSSNGHKNGHDDEKGEHDMITAASSPIRHAETHAEGARRSARPTRRRRSPRRGWAST